MIAKNVRTIVSVGETCFVCDKSTSNGEYAIQVSFNYPVPLIGSITVRQEMHVRCAVDLRKILDERIKEAAGERERKKR